MSVIESSLTVEQGQVGASGKQEGRMKLSHGSFGAWAIAALLFSAPAEAQHDEAALQLLNQAIQAHQQNGRPLQAQLRFSGEGPQPTQGLNPLGPFEMYPIERTVVIDEANPASFVQERAAIAGLDLSRTFINTPSLGIVVDDLQKSYDEASTPPGFLATLLPHRRLKSIRETATDLQLDPASKWSIKFTMRDGGVGRLTLHPGTTLVARFDLPPSSGIYGEERVILTYPSYRTLGGTAVPDSYIARTENRIFAQEARLRLVSGELGAPRQMFQRPMEVKPAERSWRPAALEVTTLAPGVHLINNITDSRDQWSYNVLAVVFDDHVLVAEAPISEEANERVIAAIGKIAPGKPIRHLVLSHHHGDHIAGVEAYVKRGIPIVTTADTATLLRRIATEKGEEFGTPQLDVVTQKRVLSDRSNEVHIYDVGRHPHSHQMLVVHLPRHHILYQVDFLNEGEYPTNVNTQALFTWIEAHHLPVRTIAGLHGRTVAYPSADE